MDSISRLLELSGVKAPTIVSATKKNGEIDRKEADKMVDPQGFFEKNKKELSESNFLLELSILNEIMVVDPMSIPRVARILQSDMPDKSKISKLETMALRAFPSSPIQNAIRAAITELQNKDKK